MPKYCLFCNDGVKYDEKNSKCPKCNYLLKIKKPTLYSETQNESVQYTDTALPVLQVQEPLSPSFESYDRSRLLVTETDDNLTETVSSRAAGVRYLPLAEGVVRNYKEDQIKSFLIRRWYLSLLYGDYFVFDTFENSFEIDSKKANNAYSVIVKGKISRGQLSVSSRVKVWGRWEKNSNSIIARQIENVGTGAKLHVNMSLSAITIRIVTILMIALVVGIAYEATKVDWGYVFAKVVAALVLILMGWVGLKYLLRRR